SSEPHDRPISVNHRLPHTWHHRFNHCGCICRTHLTTPNNLGDVLHSEQIPASHPQMRNPAPTSLLLHPPLRAAQQVRNLHGPVEHHGQLDATCHRHALLVRS